MSSNLLEKLRELAIVVGDPGDLKKIERFAP